jgi:hypothetical protein
VWNELHVRVESEGKLSATIGPKRTRYYKRTYELSATIALATLVIPTLAVECKI